MSSARTKIYKKIPKEEISSSFYFTMSCPKRFREANITSNTFQKSPSVHGTSTIQLQEITLNNIKLAAKTLENYIVKTPCLKSNLLDNMGIKLYIKEELRQVTDSYKARGVIYTLLRLSEQQKKKGVITASTGNFAYVLSFYGKRFSIPVVVVIPISSIDMDRVKICQTYSKVFIEGRDLEEAHEIALRKAIELDMLYLDGFLIEQCFSDKYDHHDIIAGQATIGLEILEQVPKIDAIVLPTVFDGCGLIAGIALAVKECNPKVKIIGVQLNNIFEPLTKTGEQTNSPHVSEVPVGGCNAFQILTNYSKCKLIDRVVLMNKQQVEMTASILCEKGDIIRMMCLSAILTDHMKDLIGKTVMIPLLGEIDTSHYLLPSNWDLLIPPPRYDSPALAE